MELEQLCKCDRCTRIRPLFQYTKFETKVVETVVNHGASVSPQYTTKREDIGEKRGLCEECAVVVNSRRFDEGVENEITLEKALVSLEKGTEYLPLAIEKALTAPAPQIAVHHLIDRLFEIYEPDPEKTHRLRVKLEATKNPNS